MLLLVLTLKRPFAALAQLARETATVVREALELRRQLKRRYGATTE